MKTSAIICLLLAGAAGGAAFVVGCSDDSPGDADAAACDCPAAEPPLAGRIRRIRITEAISPMGTASPGAVCPTGSTVLGGSCRLMTGQQDIYLNQAGIDQDLAYLCRWKSMSVQPDTGIAEAICLMPAQ